MTCLHLICDPIHFKWLVGFEVALEEARERSKAGGKKTGPSGIKFEAEATGHLQKHSVALTVSDIQMLFFPHILMQSTPHACCLALSGVIFVGGVLHAMFCFNQGVICSFHTTGCF